MKRVEPTIEDIHFMREALKEAEKALESGNWPVGCVIVIDGKIVSRGYNKVYSQNNKIKHAEIDAIEKIPELLSIRGREATVYVTYEPCPMCFGAVLLNHFKRVVCGPDLDGSGGTGILENLPARYSKEKYQFELVTGVLENECKALFLQGKPVRNNEHFIQKMQ